MCQEDQAAQCWGEGTGTFSSGLQDSIPRALFYTLYSKRDADGSGPCGPGLQFPLGFYNNPSASLTVLQGVGLCHQPWTPGLTKQGLLVTPTPHQVSLTTATAVFPGCGW